MQSRRPVADSEAGEGYFASISDLMVGVLFVFLLMLTVFALNFRDAETNETVARDKYEQAVGDVAKQQALAVAAEAEAQERTKDNDRLRALLRQTAVQVQRDNQDREESRTHLLIALQSALHDRRVDVALDPLSGVLRLSGDLLFDTGSASLAPKARDVVRAMAAVLAEALPSAATQLEALLVEGHTDRQHFPGVAAVEAQARNDRLSADRALAVFLEMRRAQPSLDQLVNAAGQPLLGVSGYGERRPRADLDCGTEANCPGNRRIDLRFVIAARNSDEVRGMLEAINTALARP